jgi:hypothetical protein
VLPEGGLIERVLTIVNVGAVAGVHRSVDEALASVQAT